MTKFQDIRHRTPRTNGTRSLATIKYIARHHSATTDGDFFSFWKRWNGVLKWGTGGYHEIILRDGTVQICYDPHEITNGVAGHNTPTFHICVVGNGSFTDAQEKAFEERCRYWQKRLNIPTNRVLGHKEFKGAFTACPGIDMNMVRRKLAGKPVQASASKTAQDLDYKTYLYGQTLWTGMGGAAVKRMQGDLTKLGYKTKADGSFGPSTKASVMQFQRDNDLAMDGIAGIATQAAMRDLLTKPKPSPKPKENPYAKLYYGWVLKNGMGGAAVKRWQGDMVKLGYELAVDGKFGNGSERAAKAFQKDHGLSVDGIVGKATQLKMVDLLTAKPEAPEGDVYRVIVNGEQIGAYSETSNMVEQAQKAIENGAKDIQLQKV